MSKPAFAKILWLLLSVCLIVQSGCNPPVSQPTGVRDVSLLVQLDTPSFIKREGWKEYQPVSFGTLVFATDLLKTDGNITLLCADLQAVQSFTGQGRNPCPLPSEGFVLQYDDMLFSTGLRGSTISAIPYLISPRNTTILDAHPNIRWQDTGSTGYTVEIRQASETTWIAKNVTGTEITYPLDAPALESSKDYLLVITDNVTGRTSTEDKEKGLGFQVVSESERTEIEAQKQAIFNLKELSEPAKKLALTMYYINLRIGGRGLWEEARLLLEEVAQAKPEEPVISLRQGDVLAKMKLWDEAESAYRNALALAEKNGDLETQADALAALWRVDSSNQGQFDDAVKIYEQIGAIEKVDLLKREKNP